MGTVRKGSHRNRGGRERPGSGEGGLVAAGFLAALLLVVECASMSPSTPTRAGVVEASDGVTVINVPPQFSGFRIATQDGLNYIDVVVSDYNSWADIFRVEVKIESDALTAVADVAFQQYPDNVTLQPQPQFTESVGSFLVRSLSSATYNTQPLTIPERTEMRITFVMSPVNGKFLSVTTTDLAGLEAFAQVEYSAGFLGRLPTVGGWILGVAAFAFTVLLVAVRIRRDHFGE
jgi:hypothetical protein